MIAKTFALFIISFGVGTSAQQLARLVPRDISERGNVRSNGGWALLPEDTPNCPNDLDICFGGTCCPTNLNCVESGAAVSLCCPGNVDCKAPYVETPYCADDSWSLWDMSQGGINNEGYFCCAPGDVGMVGPGGRSCVSNDTISSPTQLALALLPGGQVISTSTIVADSTTSTSVAVTTVSKTTVTPTVTAVSSSTSSNVVTSSSGSSTVSLGSTLTAAGVSGEKTGATSSGSATGFTSSSASASASGSKTSDGNNHKTYEFLWLAHTAFALLIGAVL